ncbi:hypothetical protein [Streptomyces sp. NPDC097610]|uniref:hypothetical protein n=1 Tax=Streptomyces sp. NPDC097610 TaxID=3157227 RepID=UPI0033225B43
MPRKLRSLKWHALAVAATTATTALLTFGAPSDANAAVPTTIPLKFTNIPS